MSEAKAEYITDQTEDENSLLLTRKQIASMLGVSDAKIRPYAEASPDFFGAVDAKGKGVRYPPDALEKFRGAIHVTPGTFRDKVAKQGSNNQGGDGQMVSTMSGANTESLTQRVNDSLAIIATVAETLSEALHPDSTKRLIDALEANAQAVRALPPSPDKLIGSMDAADLLHCKPRSVSRYVKPVRPGVYRESDLLRYIAGMEQRK